MKGITIIDLIKVYFNTIRDYKKTRYLPVMIIASPPILIMIYLSYLWMIKANNQTTQK